MRIPTGLPHIRRPPWRNRDDNCRRPAQIILLQQQRQDDDGLPARTMGVADVDISRSAAQSRPGHRRIYQGREPKGASASQQEPVRGARLGRDRRDRVPPARRPLPREPGAQPARAGSHRSQVLV